MQRLVLGLLFAIVVGASAAGQSAPAADGATLFAENCSVCHGSGGVGGIAPSLANNVFVGSTANLVDQILFGDGPMAGFAGRRTDQEIAAVANFVRMELNSYADPIGADFVAGRR